MNRPEPRHFMLAGEVDDLPTNERALVHGALDALHACELTGVLSTLAGIFGPLHDDDAADDARAARLFDGADRLQPLAELMLRELFWVSTAAGWTLTMRLERAIETLVLCGWL